MKIGGWYLLNKKHNIFEIKLFIITMKKLLIIFLLVLFNNLKSEWIFQNSQTANNLSDVYFIDVYNGIVVGERGTIIKTTNGGINWSVIQSPVSENFHTCLLLDANTGFALAYKTLLRTTNGGLNWNIVMKVSGDSSLNAISFFKNSSTGFVLGPCLAFKTTNSGANWTSIYTCPNLPYGEGNIYFKCADRLNDTTIVAGGSIGVAHFPPSSCFVTITPSSSIYGSNYSADSWIGWIKFAGNSGIGYAFQRGTYLRTQSGYGWSRYYKFPSFGTVSFYNDSIGFFKSSVQSVNVFYYTTNSGDSWIYYDSIVGPTALITLTKFQLISGNVLTVVGYRGIIIRNNYLFPRIRNLKTNEPEYFKLDQN